MQEFVAQHKSKLHLVFVVIIVLIIFTLGFLTGKKFSPASKTTTPAPSSDKRAQELEEEIKTIFQDRAVVEKTDKFVFSRDKMGFYSPLLESKEVEVITYKYKRQNITLKRIAINDHSGIEVWTYDGRGYDVPEEFAIFGGYENYLNNATLVEDIKEDWKESYTTTEGVKMFYSYETTPKTIGIVKLDSFHDFFLNFKESRPTLMRIWNSKIEFFDISKSNPGFIEVKRELNKIADTIEFGIPD